LRSDAPGISAKSRLLYIDNLRTALISLVVVGHLAITYGGIGDWYYREQGASSGLFPILAITIGAILMAFLLGLFSLIAGYFTVPAFDRKGAAGFLLDRVKRLAIPLIFYEVILNPVIRYIRNVQGGYTGSFRESIRAYFSPLKSIADGPVWFLGMLLLFSVGYAAWRLLAAALRRITGKPQPEDSLKNNLPGNGAIALFTLVLGFATWIVRIWAPAGRIFEPWHQEPAHYPQYVAMFVLGLFAYRRDGLTAFPEAQARLWRRLIPVLVIAFGGVAAAAGAFGGKLDERAGGGFHWQSLIYAMWEAWICVAVSLVLLTWFRKRFARQGRLAKSLSSAAFGVYVFHPAVIVPLAIALQGIRMNPGLKFLLITPVALGLCFLISNLLKNVPGVKNIL
jgi:fucose 4-O-acetylase-like acetyltransferase